MSELQPFFFVMAPLSIGSEIYTTCCISKSFNEQICVENTEEKSGRKEDKESLQTTDSNHIITKEWDEKGSGKISFFEEFWK